MERNEIHMRHLINEFSAELQKEIGVILEYDIVSRKFIPDPRILKFIKYLRYAQAIGYDDGLCQISHRKKIHQIKDGKVVATYDSITQAAKAINGDRGTISKIAIGRGSYKSHKGFEWKYA